MFLLLMAKNVLRMATNGATSKPFCFNTNTQPQYVLVSPDEKLLNTPWNGYDANPDKYQAFLECGLSANKLK
jgi:hypothetical protein